MQLKIAVARPMLVDGGVHDITAELTDYAAGWSNPTARLVELHGQVNAALDAIEARLQEPQPRPAAPHLVQPAGQGIREVQP